MKKNITTIKKKDEYELQKDKKLFWKMDFKCILSDDFELFFFL